MSEASGPETNLDRQAELHDRAHARGEHAGRVVANCPPCEFDWHESLGDPDPIPAPPADPDPDALIVRWQRLDEDQQEQVIEFLAQRRTDVFVDVLDFEERTRPDD